MFANIMQLLNLNVNIILMNCCQTEGGTEKQSADYENSSWDKSFWYGFVHLVMREKEPRCFLDIVLIGFADALEWRDERNKGWLPEF